MKKKIDPESQAALEMVKMEREREEVERIEREKREKMRSQIYRMLGRIETARLFEKLATVSGLVWLKQVKESKIYREIPEIGSWEKFCISVGYSRRHIDERLQFLDSFGEEFLETVASFSLGYRDLRRLKRLAKDGAVEVQEKVVKVGEEEIPLTPEHAEDLRVALDRLLDHKNREIEERNAAIKAKERLMAAKEEVIRRQEKEIARLEGQAKRKGLSADEQAFLRKVEAFRQAFDGVMVMVDPERLEDLQSQDRTVRMEVAYIELLDYMRRQATAAYEAAVDTYGSPAAYPEATVWEPPEEARGE